MMRIGIAAAALVALLAGHGSAQDDTSRESPFRPFDRDAFVAHVKTLGASDEALQRFVALADDGQAGRAADELLRELVPALDEAATLAEDGDPRAPIALMALVTDDADPLVRAHARYHAGRAFLDADDPERAVEVLADYLRQDRNHTALDAEATFFYATALADIPRPEFAARAFADFLTLFPDASERFRAVAQQRRAELEAQFDNPLHQIADQMKGVERDLRKTRTGDPVQTEQLEIVSKLQKIIEELEEQERRSGGAPSGNNPSSSPAASSSAPEGASRVGTLDRVPGVADRWGEMTDREREAIETEVTTRLDGRARQLVESYFESLNKDRK
ncbi:MAG: hypothetical protein IPM29_31915 [Planctomycetes bacterium]|nr:hypothetical protein [Planctomycetota bacterium]